MPFRAIGWSRDDDIILVQTVKPHEILYRVKILTRKIIITRQSKWQEVSDVVGKPVEECKKRWRGLRNSYMRNKRYGSVYRGKVFDEMAFLDDSPEDIMDQDQDQGQVQDQGEDQDQETDDVAEETISEEETNQLSIKFETEEEVITDNQGYYEMAVVDIPQEQNTTQQLIKVLPQLVPKAQNSEIKKNGMKNAGRRKYVPSVRDYQPPVKILPKPVIINASKISPLIQNPLEPKSQQFIQKAPEQRPEFVQRVTPEQRSQSIDKLIERILKESTNEIDVFFKSMATSVKKLDPNLIPKVKMEVCNVIAKYEMQSYENKQSNGG